MFNLKQVNKVEVIEIPSDGEVYQRQYEVESGDLTWFIATEYSWIWVQQDCQDRLEAEWQKLINPAPVTMTVEDYNDAMCEQRASRDYEYSVYGD
jgi:hypothetical protein